MREIRSTILALGNRECQSPGRDAPMHPLLNQGLCSRALDTKTTAAISEVMPANQ